MFRTVWIELVRGTQLCNLRQPRLIIVTLGFFEYRFYKVHSLGFFLKSSGLLLIKDTRRGLHRAQKDAFDDFVTVSPIFVFFRFG